MWGKHDLVRLAAWLSGLAAVLLCFVVIAERIQPKPDLQPAFPGYRVLADVPLSGGSSRFDYQSFDASSQRLYVAHPEAGTITVFDAATGEVLRDITGLTDVHGVLAVPEYNRLFATEQSLSALAVIDTQTFDVVAEAPAGEGPDSLAYAPEERRVFVADERGGMVTVIDVSSEEPVAQISVGSRLGIIQYDAARHRVLVVSGASNELAEIDPASNAITEEHTIAGCAGAHSLYL